MGSKAWRPQGGAGPKGVGTENGPGGLSPGTLRRGI